MEKFMYLFRGGDAEMAVLSPEGLQEHMQKWVSWMQGLAEKGNFVAGEPLAREGKQVNGTNKVVSDGPFVEVKEMVGGYLIIYAKNIDDAVELSKACPILEFNGKIEIRGINKLEI